MKVLPMLSFVAAAGFGVMWWSSENRIRLPEAISTPLLVSRARMPEEEQTIDLPPARISAKDAKPISQLFENAQEAVATVSKSRVVAPADPNLPSVTLGEAEPILMALSKPLPSQSELHSVFSDPAAAPSAGSSAAESRPQSRSGRKRISSQPAGTAAPEKAPPAKVEEAEPVAVFGDSIEEEAGANKPAVVKKSPTVTKPVSEEDALLGRWEVAYQSAENLPIYVRTMGRGENSVLVIAGLEGTDRVSVVWADKLTTRLSKERSLLEAYKFTIVRAANPDGLKANRRTNSRDVDINRNFPTANFSRGQNKRSGDSPASEVETRAILQLMSTTRPSKVVILRSTAASSAEVVHSMTAKDLANQLMTSSRWKPHLLLSSDWPGSLEVVADETVGAQVLSVSLPTGNDYNTEFDKHVTGLLTAMSGKSAESLSPLAKNRNFQQLDQLMARSAQSAGPEKTEANSMNLDDYQLGTKGVPTSAQGGNVPLNRKGYQELPPPPRNKT